jgi:hypothetical protein
LDGQGDFGIQKIITVNSNGAGFVNAADIDGDGDIDVLSTSGDDYNVAWHENLDGQGTFGPPLIISGGMLIGLSICPVDIDGDGDIDIVSSTGGDSKIVWHENLDGQGNFGSQQLITTNADWPYSIYATDVDADGDIDVLSASTGDNTIAWYENLDGQGTFGPQQIISTEADYALSVYAADLDGDGDMDVLSASSDDNKVAWYENLDGQGDFGIQKIITVNSNGAGFVNAADIDGDGDIDVLSTSGDDYNVAWHENLDGQGTFGPPLIISGGMLIGLSICPVDIDGDGDIDIVSSTGGDSKIVWHENLDGQGNFGSQQLITTNADWPYSIYATDVDADGDIDVLSASTGDNTIAWYENLDGQGTFGPQQIISTEADYALSVYAADLDGDGDMDVLSASSDDNKVAWYENLDGQGNFGTQKIISTSANYNRSVFSEDIDGDGDLDVISISSNPNLVTYFENLDGQGNFGPQQIVTSNVIYPTSVFAADINGDGDIDILSTSTGDDKIAWYENLGPLSIEEFFFDDLIVYPNPTSGVLIIQAQIEIVRLEIYNQLGQLISETNSQSLIDISKSKKGLYFLKIYDISGKCRIKKVLKK